MKLPAGGVEYVTFTVTADFTLDGTIEIAVRTTEGYPPADTTWAPATWDGPETVVGDIHIRKFVTLLAGSAVSPLPAEATKLTKGQNYVSVRISDTPEVIIRPAGRIEAL